MNPLKEIYKLVFPQKFTILATWISNLKSLKGLDKIWGSAEFNETSKKLVER